MVFVLAHQNFHMLLYKGAISRSHEGPCLFGNTYMFSSSTWSRPQPRPRVKNRHRPRNLTYPMEHKTIYVLTRLDLQVTQKYAIMGRYIIQTRAPVLQNRECSVETKGRMA